jgi:alkanesulfonate monooxygenase SsuD/methylene tetrahydromethanopterin reductase-like flavin-dependent oxidoreductase (luciferase family)
LTPRLRPVRAAPTTELHIALYRLRPIAKATGALGNTSCLVGTPEQVTESILECYRLGINSFLIRGFDPMNDATEFGKELIPRVKAGAAAIPDSVER